MTQSSHFKQRKGKLMSEKGYRSGCSNYLASESSSWKVGSAGTLNKHIIFKLTLRAGIRRFCRPNHFTPVWSKNHADVPFTQNSNNITEFRCNMCKQLANTFWQLHNWRLLMKFKESIIFVLRLTRMTYSYWCIAVYGEFIKPSQLDYFTTKKLVFIHASKKNIADKSTIFLHDFSKLIFTVDKKLLFISIF